MKSWFCQYLGKGTERDAHLLTLSSMLRTKSKTLNFISGNPWLLNFSIYPILCSKFKILERSRMWLEVIEMKGSVPTYHLGYIQAIRQKKLTKLSYSLFEFIKLSSTSASLWSRKNRCSPNLKISRPNCRNCVSTVLIIKFIVYRLRFI